MPYRGALTVERGHQTGWVRTGENALITSAIREQGTLNDRPFAAGFRHSQAAWSQFAAPGRPEVLGAELIGVEDREAIALDLVRRTLPPVRTLSRQGHRMAEDKSPWHFV